MKNKNTLMSIFLIILVFGIFLKYNKSDKIQDKINTKQKETYIKQTILTDEQKEKIQNKNDNEILAFKYSVADNIKSIHIDFLEYKEDGFKSFASSSINLDEDEKQGILAFVIEKDKYKDILFNDKGFNMSEFSYNLEFNDKTIINKITESVCTVNKEIPVFEKYQDENRDKYDSSITDFRKQKCDKGLVITLTFKDTDLK